jgi:hypothetical protein
MDQPVQHDEWPHIAHSAAEFHLDRGDPLSFVNITLVSSTLVSGLEPNPTTPGQIVECIAPNTGSFSVPTYVLQTLPSTASSTALVPPGEILVGPTQADYTLPPPSGLDALLIFYKLIAGTNVVWQ